MRSAANFSVDHYQYYPTGERLAAKAWAKFQNPIQHLCDPSAGKGHLIRFAQEGFPGLSEDELPWVAFLDDEDSKQGRFKARLRTYARAKFEGVKNVSAVEINVAHHASLRELGAKIIGHDFLQVRSLGTVSQVIMNPPFLNGCAHVLHAWDCVYDAEIVAIVNAETVRNPFSADRRRLVQLIENHGSVEFLQEQFVDDVERKTDVEVALIYLQKSPGQYLNMEMLTGGLKRGENGAEEEIDPEMCNALALPGNFIQDTVSRFNRSVEFARKASEAQAVATYLQKSLGFTLEQMQAKGLDSSHREDLLSVRRESNADFATRYADLKQRAWAQIIRSSLLTSKLSNRARLQLESQAASIYELEFTLGNIHGFMAGVIASMGDIYQSMLLDMFDAIIERSEDNVAYYRAFYKSNQKHRIGMRLRKTRFILPRISADRSGFGYESERFLADIDLCWGYLFGVSGEYDGIVQTARQQGLVSGERYSSRFFDFRFFAGTGTIHVFARSPEVMDKMNRFVGKVRQWIPGDMGEANADFRKQYDKAESMTEAYLDAYRGNSVSRSGTRLHFKMVAAINGASNDDPSPELDRLEASIDTVHEQQGLRCGPTLGSQSTAKVQHEEGGGTEAGQVLMLPA